MKIARRACTWSCCVRAFKHLELLTDTRLCRFGMLCLLPEVMSNLNLRAAAWRMRPVHLEKEEAAKARAAPTAKLLLSI